MTLMTCVLFDDYDDVIPFSIGKCIPVDTVNIM